VTPDTISSIRILKTVDPVTTQIPVKKSAAIARIAFFTGSVEVYENLTAKMSRIINRIIWKIIPLFIGSPRVFTKNQSNFDEIVTTPGIIPYINNARSIIETDKENKKPFRENSNFLK
jgi:hypothetical protein